MADPNLELGHLAFLQRVSVSMGNKPKKTGLERPCFPCCTPSAGESQRDALVRPETPDPAKPA